VLEHAVVPGALAVDGGAHLGYVTLAMARAGARVLAFEPNPSMQGVLTANVSRNDLSDRVTVVPCALGAEAGKALLTLSGGGDTSTLARGKGLPVAVVALDAELGEELPAVVKLDLEGWEVQALRGMPRVLASDVVLVVECNPDALSAAGTSSEELLQVISDSGLHVLQVDEEQQRLLREIRITVGGEYVNLVAARPERAAALLEQFT
jgi:FkbM family methyltransferase